MQKEIGSVVSGRRLRENKPPGILCQGSGSLPECKPVFFNVVYPPTGHTKPLRMMT